MLIINIEYKRLKLIAGVCYALSVLSCVLCFVTSIIDIGIYLALIPLLSCIVFTILTWIMQVQIYKYNIDKVLSRGKLDEDNKI